jgi:hypothetical protein
MKITCHDAKSAKLTGIKFELTSACPVKFFGEKERSEFNRGPPTSVLWSCFVPHPSAAVFLRFSALRLLVLTFLANNLIGVN